jgi:hypothetical protein
MSFPVERVGEATVVARYGTAEDLEPARQEQLLRLVREHGNTRQVGLVFVVGERVRLVDVSIPAFWLRVTADPMFPVTAMAIVSPSVAVRLAASAFDVANAVRGRSLKARAFETEREALNWVERELARETVAPRKA